MFETRIYKILMDSPSDVSGLEKLIDKGDVAPGDIKGIMVMHEGDSFARDFTTFAFATMLADKMKTSREEVKRTLPIQGIAGLAGLMIPHYVVFVRRKVEGKESKEKRMAVAGACTRVLLPEEFGTMAHIREVSKTVKDLMKDAQINDPKDVHFVFVKGPWLSINQRKDAEARGKKLVSDNRLEIGQLSRGAGALGVAVALGEVKESQLADGNFLQKPDEIYSLIAHTSGGDERNSCAVILLGNTTKSTSDLIIGHGMLKDALDGTGVKNILKDMGFKFNCCPSAEDLKRIEYAFLKPKGREVPTIRGYRHTMNSDPVLGPFGWNVEKCPGHAVVASILGTPLFEVASGPECQGPPGSPLLAVVARTS